MRILPHFSAPLPRELEVRYRARRLRETLPLLAGLSILALIALLLSITWDLMTATDFLLRSLPFRLVGLSWAGLCLIGCTLWRDPRLVPAAAIATAVVGGITLAGIGGAAAPEQSYGMIAPGVALFVVASAMIAPTLGLILRCGIIVTCIYAIGGVLADEPLATLVQQELFVATGVVVALFVAGTNDYFRRTHYAIAAARAQTEAARAAEDRERARYLVRHDPLTELLNRDALVADLDGEIGARPDHAFDLVVVNLDRFGALSGRHGPAMADDLLVALARRMRQRLPGAEFAARIGGDEFALVERPSESAGSGGFVAAVRSLLADPFALAGKTVAVTATFGVARYPADGRDGAALVAQARIALDEARRGHRAVGFFSARLDNVARRRARTVEALNRAIEQGGFELHYQPQHRLRDGALVGAEALLRWRDVDGVMIPPAEFIPLAEEAGLIQSIGQWVIEEACAQARRWAAQGLPPLRLAVNVSPLQLRQPDFPERVALALAESGVAPDWLSMEITESAAMSDIEGSVELLARVKATGVTVALDDFGTGHASLAWLNRLPVDYLKIDRSFVSELPWNANALTISRGLIGMARGLGLGIIAEGIETSGQEALLRAAGCDMGQGYHYSRPLPADHFAAYVIRHLAERAPPRVVAME